jgi:hypothetical protein
MSYNFFLTPRFAAGNQITVWPLSIFIINYHYNLKKWNNNKIKKSGGGKPRRNPFA